MIEFRKITDFPRGTLYSILADAYSFDERNRRIWDADWKETDDFFYDNPEIAGKYGLVTCLDGEPIGFVTWDPRHRPEYVEIGHNGIREKYKGRGYGRLQLQEALRRIKEYDGLKRIIVGTNSNLVAPRNYKSAGFVLYDRKPNRTETAYTGDYLYYEIILDGREKRMIREAAADDAARIAEIDVASSRYAYKNILPDEILYHDLSVENRVPVYQRWIAEKRFDLYVYEDPAAETVKGMMGIGLCEDEDKKDAFELHFLYLDPDYVRMGIGSEMLRFFEQKGREKGCPEFVVWVLEENEQARHFYEKNTINY